jgi:serine/threonine protein kinase
VIDLVRGRLDSAALARAERHVADCSLCGDLLAATSVVCGPTDADPPAPAGVARDQITLPAPETAREPPTPAGVLAPGTILRETYEIVRFISAGGMGEVYEARHARLAGRYAVKVLSPHIAGHPARRCSIPISCK